MKHDAWVARCCDELEQAGSALDQDHTLVWLVRLQHIATDINELNRSCRKAGGGGGGGAPPSEHHQKLIRIGLETQLREWQDAIPERFTAARRSISLVYIIIPWYPFDSDSDFDLSDFQIYTIYPLPTLPPELTISQAKQKANTHTHTHTQKPQQASH